MAPIIVFADTNVFLDALLDRGKSVECIEILKWAEIRKVILYAAPSSLLTVIYFLHKFDIPKKEIKATITDLLSLIHLKSIEADDFTTAFSLSFNDLEDAVLFQTATEIKGIAYFVTSNLKDFQKAPKKLRIISPGDFIALLKE